MRTRVTRRRQPLVRPEGWVAPGPRPRGAAGRPHLIAASDEDLCALTGDFHLFQLRVGHRWSIDDLMTAWVAVDWLDRHAPPEGARHLDLGCGIGSVLLMVAWAFPALRSVGVEAQSRSAGLARRSVEWNGVEDRVEVLDGDLRVVADSGFAQVRTGGSGFDVVTGTPPYFDVADGVVSDRPQRGPCRFETRGGVEDYARAAARVLAPSGVFVVCETALAPERTSHALEAVGLAEREVLEVFPKSGKPALFTVHVATWPRDDTQVVKRSITIRDQDGRRTTAASEVRRRMGLPW
jgi:tRNA1Val (adenine37-N6)-methyltransferase